LSLNTCGPIGFSLTGNEISSFFGNYYFDHYIISSFFLSNCSSYYYLSIFSDLVIVYSFSYSFSYSLTSLFNSSIFNSSIFNSNCYFWSSLLISRSFMQSSSCFPFYLFDINRFLIIPLWTSFKIIVFSFDVIHSLGFYCFGIKIDAIPGRINLASTLRSLFKGEHRGFCFELCGQGHSSMLIVGLIL
jgi:heme/copper-type cytochrome/quinol oxidase subunit 2